MICFKDRAFCSAFGATCKNDKCSRAFTEQESAAARRWWGSDDAPVAFSDLSVGCTEIIPSAELTPKHEG